MHARYILILSYHPGLCITPFPKTFNYFQRVADAMAPPRALSYRKYNCLFYLFDTMADIWHFYRKITTIMPRPLVQLWPLDRRLKLLC